MSIVKSLNIILVICMNTSILHCNDFKLKYIINESQNNIAICIKNQDGDTLLLRTIAANEDITLKLPVNILKENESWSYILLSSYPIDIYNETNIYIHPKIKHYYVGQIKATENSEINNTNNNNINADLDIMYIPTNPYSRSNIYRNIVCSPGETVFDLGNNITKTYTALSTDLPYSYYLIFEITDNCKLKVHTAYIKMLTTLKNTQESDEPSLCTLL